MSFFQNGPALSNLFTQDIFLVRALERQISKEHLSGNQKNLEKLGALSAKVYSAWQIKADKNPPALNQFDPWGRRVCEIEAAKHWDDFKKEAVEWQIVGRGHDKALGPYARLIQCAYMLLFSPTTANYLCPLAMSDAAACVIRKIGKDSVKSRLYDRLITGDLKASITSGQWMTERPGGSDVSESETTAVFLEEKFGEKKYRLDGVKWFTSSITSEMSLLLARVIEAGHDHGLTLFLWEREDMPGCGQQHKVDVLRLKDKLGTRALPTAEIELKGTIGTLLGEVGRGVADISEMLNVTRFYNAVASAASMNYSSLLVEDYCDKRIAFGQKIGRHILMAEVMHDLKFQAQKATALCFEVARLLGKCEVHEASKDEALCMRALVSLSKLALGKAAVAHASETLECFGGAGYIEDTGLPRILRDAQVLPIWEGTTNVLCLDLWRAELKEGAVSALLADVQRRVGVLCKKSVPHSNAVLQIAADLQTDLQVRKSQEAPDCLRNLRQFVFKLADSVQQLLMLEHNAGIAIYAPNKTSVF